MPSEKSRQIIGEMVQLAVNIIKFCETKHLPNSIIDQVTRSSSSIGANFSEAQDADSKRDFVNKIYIAKKEAGATRYWLDVMSKLIGISDEITKLSEQTQQFSRLLQKIINTSRATHAQ